MNHTDRVSDLYAALAAHWVAHACFEHFTLVSVADAARIDAWFRLSFGLQQIYALLPLDDRDMSPPRDSPKLNHPRSCIMVQLYTTWRNTYGSDELTQIAVHRHR